MTKSIEEQAREFVKNKICFNGLEYSIGSNTYEECVLSYIVGAKARDAQWSAVVNIFKSQDRLKGYPTGIEWQQLISKADQMLRDMGMR